ncbi:hypothetical protein CPC08DRAFT_419868 [Agrocybe pediades]|nr:hypothetical protein CPC08DRAFT_419868 [Agrocybe pediades]
MRRSQPLHELLGLSTVCAYKKSEGVLLFRLSSTSGPADAFPSLWGLKREVAHDSCFLEGVFVTRCIRSADALDTRSEGARPETTVVMNMAVGNNRSKGWANMRVLAAWTGECRCASRVSWVSWDSRRLAYAGGCSLVEQARMSTNNFWNLWHLRDAIFSFRRRNEGEQLFIQRAEFPKLSVECITN